MAVLIIEKDRDLLSSLQRLLQNNTIETHIAFDGVQAMENINNTNYDVIVSDLDVPRISYSEITKTAKQKFAKTKIIAIGKIEKTFEDFDNQFEFDKFISMPFDATTFLSIVKEMLDIKN